MPDIQRVEIVKYTPEQMYDLVNEVEKYPEFVPWCHSTKVHSRNDDEVRATMCFEGGGIRKSFTTCNRLQKNKMIELKLVDGPFRQLEGFWRFDDHGDEGCKIIFDLDFEFDSKLLSIAFGPFFSQVSHTLVDTFITRADEVYQA